MTACHAEMCFDLGEERERILCIYSIGLDHRRKHRFLDEINYSLLVENDARRVSVFCVQEIITVLTMSRLGWEQLMHTRFECRKIVSRNMLPTLDFAWFNNSLN